MRWKIRFWAIAVGLPVLFTGLILLLPPQFDETYPGELPYKIEWLKKTEAPRIIIVGGSATAFGIRSDLIEEELGMEVVNFGLYAPLGSKTMLEVCFEWIREGDIVVFSPEQNRETLSFSFQPKEVWEAVDGKFYLMSGVFGEEEWKKMLGAFPAFAAAKLKYEITGKPQPEGIYSRRSFNLYGDIDAAGREQNIMPEQYDSTMKIDFTELPEEEFLQYLNDYAERVRKKGAEFYYRFCPMNELAVENEAGLDPYVSMLQKNANYKILGDPHKCVLESGWFYDTNFHLNESGAIVNTYYFVRDLKAEWKDASKTEIQLPQMPKTQESTEEREDKDARYFVYEEQNGSLYIVGVTEEGAEKKELTIPQYYDEKRVTEVAEETFAECTGLEQVTVNGGIALQDGCFQGCKTLKKIILNGKPSEILAGANLMQGTDALLYTAYYDAYILDYSWGLYSDKIREITE